MNGIYGAHWHEFLFNGFLVIQIFIIHHLMKKIIQNTHPFRACKISIVLWADLSSMNTMNLSSQHITIQEMKDQIVT